MPAERGPVVDLLRHGEPVGGRRYRGRTDDPLSGRGWAQMRAQAAAHGPWARIVSSPLARCRAFAEALASETGAALRIDPRLEELGYGAWEGLTHAEVAARFPAELAAFRRDPLRHRPPGAEPLGDFLARVGEAWAEAEAEARGSGGPVLVVTHAGVIRAVLGIVLGMPPAATFRVMAGYAALTRLRLDPDRGPCLLWHGLEPCAA